jgi:hypothetical protein
MRIQLVYLVVNKKIINLIHLINQILTLNENESD